jgi:hypothetical protein
LSLQALRDNRVVAAAASASARTFMRCASLFVLQTKWPDADWVPAGPKVSLNA